MLSFEEFVALFIAAAAALFAVVKLRERLRRVDHDPMSELDPDWEVR